MHFSEQRSLNLVATSFRLSIGTCCKMSWPVAVFSKRTVALGAPQTRIFLHALALLLASILTAVVIAFGSLGKMLLLQVAARDMMLVPSKLPSPFWLGWSLRRIVAVQMPNDLLCWDLHGGTLGGLPTACFDTMGSSKGCVR